MKISIYEAFFLGNQHEWRYIKVSYIN